MPAQEANWSCSACSLAWVLRSTGLEPGANEQDCIAALGYCPTCAAGCGISSSLGLCDASGPELRRIYAEHGQDTAQAWLDFDTVYELAQHTTGQMSGAVWNHWVALRGVQGATIWVANSAQGYKGIWNNVSREDFARLGGFSVVWLTD
jgi:hypothetical protein